MLKIYGNKYNSNLKKKYITKKKIKIKIKGIKKLGKPKIEKPKKLIILYCSKGEKNILANYIYFFLNQKKNIY